MAEGVFLPSAEYGVEQLIADLAKIVEIPAATIDSFAAALDRIEGIPTAQILIDVVIQFIGNNESGAAVVSLLGNVVPESLDDVMEAVNQLRQSNAEVSVVFTDQVFSDLRVKLPRLIYEFPAISKYKKAIYLSRLTGCSARSVDIVCDIRPLFSDDRNEILGLIPQSTIRLAYESQDGTDHVIEVTVSEELLQTIAEKVHLAQRKLQVIQAASNKWIPCSSPEVS